jgi:hypothetical protein
MHLHRASQAAEWAVVAAVIGLHAFIHVQSQEQPAAWWLQAAADVQPLVVTTLLAAWIVLGPGWHLVRIIAAGPLLLSGVWLLAAGAQYFQVVPVPWPFAFAFAVIPLIVVLRTLGLRVTGTSRPNIRPQFSIFTLLVVTTAVGLLFGSLQLLQPVIASPDPELADLRAWLIGIERDVTYGRLELVRSLVPTPATVRQFVLAAAVAGSAIGALATVLRPGTVWLRLAILAVAIPSLSAYLSHLAGDGNTLGTTAGELAIALAAVAALGGVSVLPLRLMGYRLCIAATNGRAAQCATRTSNVPAHAHASVGVAPEVVAPDRSLAR